MKLSELSNILNIRSFALDCLKYALLIMVFRSSLLALKLVDPNYIIFIFSVLGLTLGNISAFDFLASSFTMNCLIILAILV